MMHNTSTKVLAGFTACVLVLAVVLMAAVGMTKAASTTKSLSTNFTLVNLGTADANVTVQYLLDSGATWTAPASSTTFTIPANGGQKIIRQYQDTMTPSSGRGSAVVSSDQPLGAVVQISAQGQTPTSGAYSGFTEGSGSFYVPLLARIGGGVSNSQIMIQNTGTSSVNAEVKLFGLGARPSYTKTGITIAGGATYYYDLNDETNLGNQSWFGSGVVNALGGGKVAVISNFFTAPDQVQTYNAFSTESAGTAWLIPQFNSRLGNGLSTPVTAQNVSGSTIPVGSITMTCTKTAGQGATTLNFTNASAIANNASYIVNPVTDQSIPASWTGACRLTGSGNMVVFVQMRTVGTANAAAYEGINANAGGTKVIVPLIAKRLGSGFATAVTIQNMSPTQAANITLTYTRSSGPGTNLSTTTTIPAGSSLIQNQRGANFAVGATTMPDGWVGSLTVESTNGVKLGAFVQLSNINPLAGDTFQAHAAFTLP